MNLNKEAENETVLEYVKVVFGFLHSLNLAFILFSKSGYKRHCCRARRCYRT